MSSLLKIMLAAILVTGSGFTLYADINRAYPKSAYDTEERHVSGFTGVSARGSFDIYIKQGAAESVTVDAPADLQEFIITEVKGGVLNIYGKKGGNWNNKKVVVYVTAKQLRSIAASGSGNAFFEGGIKADALKLSVSGSGNVNGKVDAQSLEVRVSGSGNMKIEGSADSSNVGVSGSGNYNGDKVKTINTAVKVSGSGNAKINAVTQVEASVSGSGSIRYTGGAKDVSSSKSGSGGISSF